MSQAQAGSNSPAGIHIFVNRRKFDESDGVMPEMSGRQIAALVGVPADVAVIRRGNSGDSPEIGVDEVVRIRKAEHFLVTRRVVEGGYEAPERIRRELKQLAAGGQVAEFLHAGR